MIRPSTRLALGLLLLGFLSMSTALLDTTWAARTKTGMQKLTELPEVTVYYQQFPRSGIHTKFLVYEVCKQGCVLTHKYRPKKGTPLVKGKPIPFQSVYYELKMDCAYTGGGYGYQLGKHVFYDKNQKAIELISGENMSSINAIGNLIGFVDKLALKAGCQVSKPRR